MKGWTMKTIDLRSYSSENFKIIRYDKKEIVFCKGIYKNGKYFIDFFKYSVDDMVLTKLNKSSIVANDFYANSIIMDDKCIRICSTVDNMNFIVKELEFHSNEFKDIYQFNRNPEYHFNMWYLTSRYMIELADESDIESKNYEINRESKGEYQRAYLHDISEGKKYEIYDKRTRLGVRDYLFCYEFQGGKFILFEEAYMEDYEKEDIYNKGIPKEKFYIKDSYIESLNILPLKEFIKNIKNNEESISFIEIHGTELDGWTRYFGMDTNFIYFRTKDFKTRVESYYSIDKNTFLKRKLQNINSDPYKDKRIIYDIDKQQVYVSEVKEDNIEIQEIYKKNINLIYPKCLGEFCNIIEDRYLITWYWIEDEEDNYFEYTVVKDIKTGTKHRYQGNCDIYEDVVVLY